MIRLPLLTALLIVMAPGPASAPVSGWSAVDGDGVRAPDGTVYRVASVDTPELKGRCRFETALAYKARAFTSEQLRRGEVAVRVVGWDRNYDRPVAVVTVNGQRLDRLLISNGLGRPYNCLHDKARGDKCPPRQGWCA